MVKEGCGIPKCSDLRAGNTRQQCTIKSLSLIREGTLTYQFENDPWEDYNNCYMNDAQSDSLRTPHRCGYKNRFPFEYRFETVDEEQKTPFFIRPTGLQNKFSHVIFVNDFC